MLEEVMTFPSPASMRQVHRARLKTGEDVVIKVIKAQNEKSFRRDVKRMRRWLRIFLIFMPKLRRVGNPVALLNHVADYTTRELDLRNEIAGADELKEIQMDIDDTFQMHRLRFPKYYDELSNEHVLVSEFIRGFIGRWNRFRNSLLVDFVRSISNSWRLSIWNRNFPWRLASW